MNQRIRKVCRRGRLDIFRKPLTADPYVNCTLTSLGVDARGVERFWISTCNKLCGASGLLIDERGGHRVYHWSGSTGIAYLYGVAQQDPDTLWLAGGWRFLIRLILSSGKWRRYEIPGGRFVTSGMAFDPGTGKLFTGARTVMISFDTRTCRPVRVYGTTERGPDRLHSDHWRNRDGTYGFLMQVPGLSYLRWYPKQERVESKRLSSDPYHDALGKLAQHKYVRSSHVYVPYMGWLDGMSGVMTPHDHPPEQEAHWFGQKGRHVLGVQGQNSGDGKFVCWDTRTGRCRELFTLPDMTGHSCALTRSGKIVSVDLTGVFRRHDAVTGMLELTRKITIHKPHVVYTITPASDDTIVGTPYICQNFWILNTRTGKGYEAGRAAAQFGQIDDALRVGDKVYFSAYGGSQLTEYDPSQPANFPRNPRLVAKSDQGQHGAGMTTDGRIIWVAYQPKYGTLDGAMIRYDTVTGEAVYRNGAVKDEHIVRPMYDPETRRIVAGTSLLSDCDTADPARKRCYAVTLDPMTLKVLKKAAAHRGARTLIVAGPLGNRKWLALAEASFGVFDEKRGTLSKSDEFRSLPEGFRRLLYAGIEGVFVRGVGNEMQLWNAVTDKVEVLAAPVPSLLRFWIHNGVIYYDCGRHVAVLRDVIGRV